MVCTAELCPNWLMLWHYRYVALPVGRYFKVRETPATRAVNNDVLEKVFRSNRKLLPNHSVIVGIMHFFISALFYANTMFANCVVIRINILIHFATVILHFFHSFIVSHFLHSYICINEHLRQRRLQ